MLVTQGLKSVAALLGIDISGWGSVFAASLVGAVFFFGNSLLGVLPAETQAIVVAVAQLIVMLLSAFGIYDTARLVGGN